MSVLTEGVGCFLSVLEGASGIPEHMGKASYPESPNLGRDDIFAPLRKLSSNFSRMPSSLLDSSSSSIVEFTGEMSEVQMIWPLCCPADNWPPYLSVKLANSGRETDSSSCLRMSSNSSRMCVLAGTCGEKLAKRPIVCSEAVFFKPGSIVTAAKNRTNSKSLPGHHAPCQLACMSANPEKQRLSFLRVYCTDGDARRVAGPAASLLCAPSAITNEVERLFATITSDLMALQEGVSHVTLRDVHGFSHLLGGRDVQRMMEPTPSSSHSVQAFRQPGSCDDPVAAKHALSVVRPFSDLGLNCSKAFELDGMFVAPKSANSNADGKSRVPSNDCSSSTRSISKAPNKAPHKTSVESLTSGESCVSQRHTGIAGSPSQLSAQVAAAVSSEWDAPGRDTLPPPWLQENPWEEEACRSAWSFYFQPLTEELDYLLTCLPHACEPGEWDVRMYISSLDRMVEFLQHHSMWNTLAALLLHAEEGGFTIQCNGRQVDCTCASGDDWDRLLRYSPSNSVSVDYPGSVSRKIPRRSKTSSNSHEFQELNSMPKSSSESRFHGFAEECVIRESMKSYTTASGLRKAVDHTSSGSHSIPPLSESLSCPDCTPRNSATFPRIPGVSRSSTSRSLGGARVSNSIDHSDILHSASRDGLHNVLVLGSSVLATVASSSETLATNPRSSRLGADNSDTVPSGSAVNQRMSTRSDCGNVSIWTMLRAWDFRSAPQDMAADASSASHHSPDVVPGVTDTLVPHLRMYWTRVSSRTGSSNSVAAVEKIAAARKVAQSLLRTECAENPMNAMYGVSDFLSALLVALLVSFVCVSVNNNRVLGAP